MGLREETGIYCTIQSSYRYSLDLGDSGRFVRPIVCAYCLPKATAIAPTAPMRSLHGDRTALPCTIRRASARVSSLDAPRFSSPFPVCVVCASTGPYSTLPTRLGLWKSIKVRLTSHGMQSFRPVDTNVAEGKRMHAGVRTLAWESCSRVHRYSRSISCGNANTDCNTIGYSSHSDGMYPGATWYTRLWVQT